MIQAIFYYGHHSNTGHTNKEEIKIQGQPEQWGSEIRTCMDFEWSLRGWFMSGPDFEWDLKSIF